MFSGMSDKALVHSNHIDLRHKHLIIPEAAGLADGNGRAFLRQLLSEGSLSYLTVEKTKDGRNGGEELPPILGPTGLIMTTTAPVLHPEDETRLLSVQIDQSPERMRQTLLAKCPSGDFLIQLNYL
jgi:hypothetical protein